MSDGATLDWLASFQRAFGTMIRTPLDRTSGTLRADTPRYESGLCGQTLPGPSLPARERLAVYNRQYWFRLFGVLQTDHRLVTALCGPWIFNAVATAFVLEHPPRGADLGEVSCGFDDFIATHHELVQRELRQGPGSLRVPHEALAQAARIDAAFRTVFHAPDEPRFRPTADQAARLPSCRLLPASAFSVVFEDWPLISLRRELGSQPVLSAVELPSRHPQGRCGWAISRTPGGERVIPLELRRAELMSLLCTYPVAEALGRLEAACEPRERDALASNAHRWLSQSVALGWWRGIEEASP